MTRPEFEADLVREGYEIARAKSSRMSTAARTPTISTARLFVLDGGITPVFGDERCVYGPGDSCNVPAGTMHDEHTEADGVRYLTGRRSPAPAEIAR